MEELKNKVKAVKAFCYLGNGMNASGAGAQW